MNTLNAIHVGNALAWVIARNCFLSHGGTGTECAQVLPSNAILIHVIGHILRQV